jgi:hypothetical protein
VHFETLNYLMNKNVIGSIITPTLIHQVPPMNANGSLGVSSVNAFPVVYIASDMMVMHARSLYRGQTSDMT